MSDWRARGSPRWVLPGLLILLAAGTVAAEDIDPEEAADQYAWGENVGWINMEPLGNGGPGVQVSDLELTGWMWGENIGWISLSCVNTSSCGATTYGVTNDGCGALAGLAWSENAGWINFAPSTCGGDPTCGVRISPATGIFSGRAWSENAGWITFSSAGPNPYRVATSWRRAVPAAATGVTAEISGSDEVLLTWSAVSGAATYDVVRGGLLALQASRGNFQSATQACVANDTTATSVTTGGEPGAGDGFWFLVRGCNCGGNGTYDDGTQAGSRDAGIVASLNDCP